MFLLTGLGNPGTRYEKTRHNVGFMAIDAIAARHGFPAFSKKYQGLLVQGTLNNSARPEGRGHAGGMQANEVGSPSARPMAFSGENSGGNINNLLLLKPQTFMNLSGESVAQAFQFYKLKPAQLIVLHDELDLPLGEVRLKKGGGTAGHNGLESIAGHIGAEFGRIRIGIGHPRGTPISVSDYVLQPFSSEERGLAEKTVALIAEHIGECVRMFMEKAFSNQKWFAA